MRTTIELDDDTATAVRDLRTQGRGVSEAVNELIRRGLVARPGRAEFVPRNRSLGLRIDVSNVSGALDLLDGPEHR